MKKAISILSLAVGIALCLAISPNGASGSPSQLPSGEKIDQIFAEWNKPDSAGCALAVIKDGRIVYEKGYGAANLDYDIPITPQTVFDIGSTSKQFTASCIALLALEGKLSLDDDIRKYIPELPEYTQPIFIRHLIHHTSGVRDYGVLWYLAGMEDQNVYTLQDIVDMCAQQKNLNFSPGDEHLYSNSGYILLAAIVERVSGMTLGAYAEKNIFAPLGMTHTLIYEDRTQVIKNRATGYSRDDKGIYHIDHYFNFAMGGDGQVLTTVEDLFLWDQNFYNPKVGGQKLLEMLLTRGSLNDGKELDYAMGLMHGEYKGLKTISHGGAWGGFRAQLIRIPAYKFTVIVLCNLGSMSPDALSHRVIDLYLADILPTEAKGTETKKSNKQDVSVDPKMLALYEGKYQLDMGLVFEISRKDGRLWAEVAGQTDFELHPVSETAFFIEEINGYLTFIRDSAGKVSQIILRQGENEMPGNKIVAAVLSPEEMQEYAGKYTSDELAVTYDLFFEDGNLYIRIKKKPKIKLEITAKDAFAGEMFKGVFERNTDGRITGFRLDAGRVKNLQFIKK